MTGLSALIKHVFKYFRAVYSHTPHLYVFGLKHDGSREMGVVARTGVV
jgi:hypothetical protein